MHTLLFYEQEKHFISKIKIKKAFLPPFTRKMAHKTPPFTRKTPPFTRKTPL
jgi:hypothetical protein